MTATFEDREPEETPKWLDRPAGLFFGCLLGRARWWRCAPARSAAAERADLSADPAYMADLEAEILTYRPTLVEALVTEIAMFRAELSGRNVG